MSVMNDMDEELYNVKEELRVAKEELRQLNVGERVVLPKKIAHAKFMIAVGEFYLKTMKEKV